MRKHIKIYCDFFGYGQDDYKPCELCKGHATDVHHISPRGMGGSKEKDFIENLMGLCRLHHDMAEAETLPEQYLRKRHLEFIEQWKQQNTSS